MLKASYLQTGQRLLAALLLALSSSQAALDSFHPDCADPHNKEITCSVHVVSCAENHLGFVQPNEEPPPAYDVRVEPYARATKAQHMLHVDISWQMPPNNDSFRLRAFLLETSAPDEEKKCFLFNVTDFGFTSDSVSPRFHFTSDSFFSFEKTYNIKLKSLPASTQKTFEVSQNVKMPTDPDMEQDDPSNITAWCKKHSQPQASKWTAAFRRIFLHSLARTIQIEFVGAPPQYCFEAYETRLMDESGLELLQVHQIKLSEMKQEMIGGKLTFFGEHNFTNLELETDYIPSVIPVERASDGRCLCPALHTNPYDDLERCSCIAAEWKKVRLNRVEKKLPPPCLDCNRNHTTLDRRAKHDNKTLPVLVVVAILSILLLVIIYALFIFYRRQRKRGKALTLHFKNIATGFGNDSLQPLTYPAGTSVLIVYSHDCALHDDTVKAFAEVLKDTFGLKVHIDEWDQDEIEENFSTYVNSSIVRAHKLIIINSIGSAIRTAARHQKNEYIEKYPQGPYDSIFESQIDLALQHPHVASVRFSYTALSYKLYSLSPFLEYSYPENLSLLMSWITGCNLRSDPRLSGFDPNLAKLNAAIARMTLYQQSEPNWFEATHRRVPTPSIKSQQPAAPSNTDTTALLETDEEPQMIETVPEEPLTRSSLHDSAYLSGFVNATSSDSQDSRFFGSERPDDPIVSNGKKRPLDSGIISDAGLSVS